jgi:methyltransferase-like protein/SAM-dependent methyltransferase
MPPEAAVSSYDEVPYPSQPFPQTHPDRLATLATLFGLRPAPPGRCRVLELGCASGGNLVPLALALPECNFVGIDFSARQVAEGRAAIQALGLRNVELHHLSITDVDESFGEFDYVIAHGVYSWVPEAVQAALLDVCARRLTADGVGYVSYNTLPGWHMKGMIRHMMCYHVSRRRGAAPAEQIREARALLQFLADAVPPDNNAYGLLLKSELETLQAHSDAYLFHEHLEEHNDPIYFFEFNERLHARGLRYLGEADLSAMVPPTLPESAAKRLAELAPNLIHMEQYLDFVRNRTFRQTLLCREHHRPSYDLHPRQMAAFHVAASLQPKSPTPDLEGTTPEVFVASSRQKLTTHSPLVKAGLLCLAQAWPRALPFAELRRQARARLGQPPDETPEGVERDTLALGDAVLRAYAAGPGVVAELWLGPPRFADRPGPRPVASPLVRLQAPGSTHVTSLRHQRVAITDFDRFLLPLLDGTRNRSRLLEALLEGFRKGALNLARDGRPITDAHQARPALAQALDEQLPRLATCALLLA